MIKRYWRLLKAFFKFSLQTEAEFRANLVFWSLQNIVWLVLSVVGVELIFGQVRSIASWDKDQVYLVLFIAGFFWDISWIFLFHNLQQFSHAVRFGELDYQMLKPVNLRFLLSFKTIDFAHFIRIFIEVFLVYQLTVKITGSFSLVNALLALFLFICSWIIFYSLYFALTTTNIWFVNLANLVDFFENINEVASKPVYIFSRGYFFLFSYLLPVAFIATFPAEALMGRINIVRLVIAPVLAVVFLYASQKFFHFALRHYSSVSR
jgi:ABC-2 type transport system permease protein